MTEDDIPANWRDDPLEDTPPVRGAFRGGLLGRLTDEQRRRLQLDTMFEKFKKGFEITALRDAKGDVFYATERDTLPGRGWRATGLSLEAVNWELRRVYETQVIHLGKQRI